LPFGLTSSDSVTKSTETTQYPTFELVEWGETAFFFFLFFNPSTFTRKEEGKRKKERKKERIPKKTRKVEKDMILKEAYSQE